LLRREEKGRKATHSRLRMTEKALRKTRGRMQYPNTEAVRCASIPDSDMRFKRAYIEMEPMRATP
jgi:hypothetical protein